MADAVDVLFEEIDTYDGNQVGVVTLNRPQALNALTHEMTVSINTQLQQWAAREAISRVIVRSKEGRAFCAGGDIRHIYDMYLRGEYIDYFRDEYTLNKTIFHFPKPYIALLDGITMGGGAGISIHGSHCIATERFIFAMPETGIGFFPDVGATYFLSRLPYKIGFYLALTGAQISFVDGLALQLAQYAVPHTALADVFTALIKSPRGKLYTTISAFHVEPKKSEFFDYADKIAAIFSKKTIEEILIELKSFSDPWCEKIMNSIEKKAPTSLKVTLHALQLAETLSFDECMTMEYRLARRFLEHTDFREGIRAAIIDKDQVPQWQPATLEEVSIEEYFAPLDQEL